MKTNQGTTDRTIRVVFGLAILSLTIVGPQSLWGLIGLVPLLRGILGVCPVYKISGINTCPAKTS
ncbi:MAG: hypothetical protein ACJAYF_000190 [Arenicella sp.]|jgi:hypothetical protein